MFDLSIYFSLAFRRVFFMKIRKVLINEIMHIKMTIQNVNNNLTCYIYCFLYISKIKKIHVHFVNKSPLKKNEIVWFVS